MKIKTYNIRNLSDRQIEKLRLACRKQHLEETFRKSNLTVTVEAITGSADPIIREYQEKGINFVMISVVHLISICCFSSNSKLDILLPPIPLASEAFAIYYLLLIVSNFNL